MSNEIVEKQRQRQSVDYQNGKVYQIVNSINDKIYIGSTSAELRVRFHRHKNEAKNNHKNRNRLFYDLLRDNVDKFKIILIEIFPCSSKQELEKREYEIMQEKINEFGRDKLYNLCLAQNGELHHMFGNKNSLGIKRTKETKLKISESTRGENNHNFGKPLSEETKLKISESTRGENNHNFGKQLLEETKLKISQAHVGKIVSEETKQKISQSKQGKYGKDSDRFKGGCIYYKKNHQNSPGLYTFQYNINSKSKSKSFSINKYGKEEAYRLCLELQKTIYPDLKQN